MGLPVDWLRASREFATGVRNARGLRQIEDNVCLLVGNEILRQAQDDTCRWWQEMFPEALGNDR